jgi:flavodoxin
MSKVAVIYASVHKGNTKRLLERIAEKVDIELIDGKEAAGRDFSGYAAVGFASGIYAGRFDRSLYAYLDTRPSLPQPTFLLYTSGFDKGGFEKDFSARLEESGHRVLGVYRCKGWSTFGPLKLFGGMSKNHPDEEEIAAGIRFVEDILERVEKESGEKA